jgi:hypothetical protein
MVRSEQSVFKRSCRQPTRSPAGCRRIDTTIAHTWHPYRAMRLPASRSLSGLPAHATDTQARSPDANAVSEWHLCFPEVVDRGRRCHDPDPCPRVRDNRVNLPEPARTASSSAMLQPPLNCPVQVRQGGLGAVAVDITNDCRIRIGLIPVVEDQIKASSTISLSTFSNIAGRYGTKT